MDNFLPGSASLVDSVDKKLMVSLRDGRKLFGILRSYDQFANLVLQDTVERIYCQDSYAEAYRGVFVIRGENVVLLGEVDDAHELHSLQGLRKISMDEINQVYKTELEEKRRRDKLRFKVLHEARGFSVDVQEHDLY